MYLKIIGQGRLKYRIAVCSEMSKIPESLVIEPVIQRIRPHEIMIQYNLGCIKYHEKDEQSPEQEMQ